MAGNKTIPPHCALKGHYYDHEVLSKVFFYKSKPKRRGLVLSENDFMDALKGVFDWLYMHIAVLLLALGKKINIPPKIKYNLVFIQQLSSLHVDEDEKTCNKLELLMMPGHVTMVGGKSSSLHQIKCL